MGTISRKDLFTYASTDTKPTTVPAYSHLIESDTGNEYEFDGNTWRQIGTAGVSHSKQTGGVWDYGPPPQNRYLNGTVTLATSATGTTIYELADVTAYNGFIFEVVAAGGTTPAIKLHVSLDGPNYSTTLPQIINLVTNTAIAGATGATGAGILSIYALNTSSEAKTKFKAIKLVITGGANDVTCTVRYAHVWA